MKNLDFTLRKKAASVRTYFTALFAVMAFLALFSIFFGGVSENTSLKTYAAQEQFSGGSTPEMLAYALDLKSASDFAVFGGKNLRNRGQSTFRGRVGSTGTVAGVPEQGDAASNGQVKQDLKDVFNIIGQLPCEQVSETALGSRTFNAGVYCLSSASLTGEMVVNAGGDQNARFVFRVAGDFSAANGATIRLGNGALASNVYIVTDGSATIGRDSRINANIIADGVINIGANSIVAAKTLGVEGDIEIESSVLGAGTGIIEICKALAPGDAIPAGTIFNFTVSGLANAIQVPAGACSAPIEVAAGNTTITEAVRSNTAVTSIVTNPAIRRVSFNLALRQVVVGIPEGDVNDQTVVTFTNQTSRTGTLEICKRALDPGVTGIFQFTVQGAPGQTFAVPVGFCSGPITTTVLQAPNTTFTANITELARPNFRLENVTTFPANRLTAPFTPDQGFDANGAPISNTNGGFANVTLISGGGVNQQTTVNFFNRSLPGVIKVCKITADPTNIPVGTIFRFTVSGLAPTSPTQTTPGTQVTRTVDVPAGPASQNGFCQFVEGTFIIGEPVTVTETGLAPGQTLPGGLTFADTRVSRIRTTVAGTTDLANRTTTFPAQNRTTEAEFTNFVFRPAILKICKIAGNGVATGTNFTFSLSLTDPLTSLPVNTAPFTIPAGSCTFANGPYPADPSFPGIGTFNFNTQIVVTEAATTGVAVTAITSPTGGPLVTDLPNRRGTMTLNQALLPNSLFNEIAFTNSAVTVPPSQAAVRFDFDGDGVSDPVIYRPSTGTWWYAASSANDQFRATRFGISTDLVVAADYDGDRRADYAVYRNGQWHILGSTDGYKVFTFGLAGDIPQPGDYDGDGKADLVVYRPSDGIWYMQMSRDGFSALKFGISTDSPEAADFDGDGKMDPAVYRNGVWYIYGSTSGVRVINFGLAGDKPVPADYDGDGRADLAVFRTGTWHILGTTTGYRSMQYGLANDTPVPADYDGDRKTDIAVYRASENVWYIMHSGDAASSTLQFGISGDVLMSY